ncbi:hypothetical protein PsorP6_013234 [Peronosclerospora sorghi]|uniref:Uncharacterized protein n=1 Tax=Peronosclerospora sorghi TaxID=230839 RepID=A0ACC0WGR4_9STRA|nr:hypothetical protein PsorP6_013234 [Peronosclerospora sorghi]
MATVSRLGNVAFIESSHKRDPTWNAGFKRFFSQHSIAWSCAECPVNTELGRDATAFGVSNAVKCTTSADTGTGGVPSPTSTQWTGYGCHCMSAGPCHGANESPVHTTKAVLDTVFAFLASPTPYEFQRRAARELRLTALLEHQQ